MIFCTALFSLSFSSVIHCSLSTRRSNKLSAYPAEEVEVFPAWMLMRSLFGTNLPTTFKMCYRFNDIGSQARSTNLQSSKQRTHLKPCLLQPVVEPVVQEVYHTLTITCKEQRADKMRGGWGMIMSQVGYRHQSLWKRPVQRNGAWVHQPRTETMPCLCNRRWPLLHSPTCSATRC